MQQCFKTSFLSATCFISLTRKYPFCFFSFMVTVSTERYVCLCDKCPCWQSCLHKRSSFCTWDIMSSLLQNNKSYFKTINPCESAWMGSREQNHLNCCSSTVICCQIAVPSGELILGERIVKSFTGGKIFILTWRAGCKACILF